MKNPGINLAHASPKKSLSEMTPNERLVFVLYLALTAPTDALCAAVGETAEEFAIGLSSAAVESCKAIALAKYQADLA